MESTNPATSDIEQMWNSLTSENQRELLQKFIETSKMHKSPSPSSPVRAQFKEGTKRGLQSPETPFQGQSRKIYSAKTTKSNHEVIVISDDSDSERPATSAVSRKLSFTSIKSVQPIAPLAPLSSSLSFKNLLGRHELSSDSDSDSLNSSSSIIQFAHDVTNRQEAAQAEAAQALQLLSNTATNALDSHLKSTTITAIGLQSEETEYTNHQLVSNFADIDIIDVEQYNPTEQVLSEQDLAQFMISSEDDDFSETDPKPTFGQFTPKEMERTNLFPAYPKSHLNGYATIVDLPPQISNIDGITKLRNALQYSLTKGAGKRPKIVRDDEGNEVKMSYHYRQCAGVKICEFMPEDLRGPHTRVDPDDLQWAKLLAAQEQAEATTHVGEIAMIYEEWSKRTCDKYEILGGQCGGQTVIRSLKPTPASSIYSRLFIGCKKWTQRSKGHIFVSLSGYDPVMILQIWGRDRCYGIHDDFKELMDGKWQERTLDGTLPKCHAVYSNLQGGKDGKCPFFHFLGTNSNLRRGKIIQLSCDVKFHFYEPIFNNKGQSSTKYMAILSYGEHSHPPPPPRKIPALVKDELIKAIRAYGVVEATARRMIASPILPIMMNGATNLSQEHIAMTNHDAVNHLIRKERLKEYPWGTDFIGVQQMMTRQGLEDPYIRATIQYPDGHFVIHCQLHQQSELFFQMYELQVDKTFDRTKCREFVVCGYDHARKGVQTLARVFTDYEDGDGYFQAFNLVFSQAEKDVGRRIPWGHLVSEKDSLVRVKAILVDEHAGQIKGLGRYFEKEYRDHDADWHILRIVRVCRVHYERSINKLQAKGVPEDLTKLLRKIPDISVLDHYLNILVKVRNEAEKAHLEVLLNWLDHKDHNPWVLQCISFATTKISHSDWMSTSKNSNNIETDHSNIQRDGVRLTLVSAVQKGQLYDRRNIKHAENVNFSGVSRHFGNNSQTGRAKKKVVRNLAMNAKKKAKGKEKEITIEGNELQVAQDLIRSGVSPDVIEKYLAMKTSSK